MEHYPENTMAEFTTRLSNIIDLKGEWEVGLVEMHYPRTWHNISRNCNRQFTITAKSQINTDAAIRTEVFQISEGYYPNIESLFEEIQKQQRKCLNETDPRISFKYHTATRTLSIDCDSCMIEVPPCIQHMLGMGSSRKLRSGTTTTMDPIDLEPIQSMFVYCDIVEPRIVGDTTASLLRIVPVEGQSGDLITRIYENIHYIPIQRKQFQTLEIYIRDHTGQKVPFERGTLNVTLHFRQRKYLP